MSYICQNAGTKHGNASPIFGNAGPVYGNAGPTYGSAGPIYGNGGPFYDNEGRIYGNAVPIYGHAAPLYGNAGPIYGNAGSIYCNVGPLYSYIWDQHFAIYRTMILPNQDLQQCWTFIWKSTGSIYKMLTYGFPFAVRKSRYVAVINSKLVIVTHRQSA